MKQATRLITALIANEVCGKALALPPGLVVTDELLSKVFEVSSAHGISHIIGSALIKNNLLFSSSFQQAFRSQMLSAVLNGENQNFAFEKISAVFEKADIPYIPLKGSVLKALYPESWMRVGCDIDILVKKEDVEKAAQLMVSEAGYTVKREGSHDIFLLSPENVCVELHFSLIDKKKSPLWAETLDAVWENSDSHHGCRYIMNDGMLYFYHIVHMAKHFRNGGCGIRPFIDLYLLMQKIDADSRNTELIEKCGLSDFVRNAEKLSRVWFDGEGHDEITLAMEEYIFQGGSFGSDKTRTIAVFQKSGSKTGYIASRIVLPYSDLSRQYPKLKGKKYLTPFYQAARVFSLLFGERKDFRRKNIEMVDEVASNIDDGSAKLFKTLGID